MGWSPYTLIPEVSLWHGAESWNCDACHRRKWKTTPLLLTFSSLPSDFSCSALPSLRDWAGVTTVTHPPHHFRCGLGPLLSVGPQSSPLSPIFLHWVLRSSSPDPCSCSKQQWPPLDTKSESLVLKKASIYTYWCVSRQLKNQCKPRVFRTIGWEEDGTQS